MSKRSKKESKEVDWFVSSFGGGSSESVASVEKPGPRKRARKNDTKSSLFSDFDSTWIEKYSPKTKLELAVHKKKVDDVSKLFESSEIDLRKTGARIILLTGPAGCGKTATINAIAGDDHLEICEWTNPVDRGIGSFDDDEKLWSGDSVFTEKQSLSFRDFLFRSSRYSLSGRCRTQKKPKILLVEDLPNVFFRDPSELHEILRQYRFKSASFCVFVISDSSGKDSSVKKLFPPDVIKRLQVDTIQFNPITSASLTRALERISVNEGYSQISKQTLESLAESSGGDVRAAINALQFACLKGSDNLERLFKSKIPVASKTTKKPTYKKSAPADSKLDADQEVFVPVGGRDATLFLFRVLGKVLYSKRDTERGIEPLRLPLHLSQEERCPLQTVPEQLLDKSSIQGSSLALFLHQNFPPFFQKLQDYSQAAEALSFGDYVAGEWKDSRPDMMEEYQGLIAVRGLMNANTQVLGGTWRSLHRPKWFDMARDLKRRESSLREEFCVTSGLTSNDVVQDILPFAKKLGVKLSHTGQRLLTELTTFRLQSGFTISRPTDILDEVDMCDALEDQDTNDVVNIEVIDDVTHEDGGWVEEEDFLIEDYDDEMRK